MTGLGAWSTGEVLVFTLLHHHTGAVACELGCGCVCVYQWTQLDLVRTQPLRQVEAILTTGNTVQVDLLWLRTGLEYIAVSGGDRWGMRIKRSRISQCPPLEAWARVMGLAPGCKEIRKPTFIVVVALRVDRMLQWLTMASWFTKWY